MRHCAAVPASVRPPLNLFVRLSAVFVAAVIGFALALVLSGAFLRSEAEIGGRPLRAMSAGEVAQARADGAALRTVHRVVIGGREILATESDALTRLPSVLVPVLFAAIAWRAGRRFDRRSSEGDRP